MERHPLDSSPSNSSSGSLQPPISYRQSPSGNDRLRPIYRVLLFAGLAVFLIFLANALVTSIGSALHKPEQWFMQGAPLAAFYALTCAALLLESSFFLRTIDQRSFRTLGLWFYPRWGRELSQGVGLGAGLMVLMVAILFAIGGVGYSGLASGGTRALLGILGAAGVMLLAAVFEEVAFRGYAFQRMVDAAGPIVAAAVFSGLFGALHLSNPSATPLSTANTALAGVLFSLAYLKTRGLWLPIGLHWAWNFTMGPIFSLPVSGMRFGPTLLRSQLTGAKWLTGGAYGPEGGAITTVVCVAVIFWLARTRRFAPSPAMEEALK